MSEILSMIESYEEKIQKGLKVTHELAQRLITRIQASPEYNEDSDSPTKNIAVNACLALYNHVSEENEASKRTVTTERENNRVIRSVSIF